MATAPRQIPVIRDAIVSDIQTRIPALTSTSQQSVFRNLAYAFAVAANQLETYYGVFETDIENRAIQIPTGTSAWYSSESLLFQFGYALTFTDGVWTYADTTSQAAEDAKIIKFAAVDVNNENLFIKVAKDDGSGLATPLDAGTELVAFREYWQLKQFPGVNINLVSQAGDQVTIEYKIGLDGNLLNPTTGQKYSDSTYPVEVAIEAYLQTFQSENFNGKFLVNKLTDTIQAVEGVKNVIPETVIIDGFDILNDVTYNRGYVTAAGWLAINPATPLRDGLTYYDYNG